MNIAEILENAEAGDAAAQYRLGVAYNKGKEWGEEGVPQNDAKAVKWYRKAAEQGHAEAQWKLGDAYGSGKGVPQDEEEAVKWFRLAADQGHAEAQWRLGSTYDSGESVLAQLCGRVKGFIAGERAGFSLPRNHEEAFKWYELAANQGHAKAQYSVGDAYDSGKGVPRDAEEAVKWHRLAADQSAANQGDAKAQFNIGLAYDSVEGLLQDDQDHHEAIKWYRLAADQGYAEAQFRLGLGYAASENTSTQSKFGTYYPGAGNPGWRCKEAAKWFELAANQGHADAQHNLAQINQP
jgi:TPR repeat protein